MSYDQRERLQRLRLARGQNSVRFEAAQSGDEGGWSPAVAAMQRRGGGRGGALIALLILAVLATVVLGGLGYAVHQFHSSAGGPRKSVTFVVAPGESVSTISDALQKDGMVSSSLMFRLYYQFLRPSGTIQAGPHLLNSDMAMDDIAKVIQSPPVVVVATPVPVQNQYNILAGKRAEEIATILSKYDVASYDDILHEIYHGKYDYWFLKGLPAGASLEGFLAPGEYTFLPHSSAHSVVALMLRKFGQEFTPAMVAQAKRSHRSIYQIVTLASIIQRENFLPKVQKAIAGVFYNRLNDTSGVTAQRLNSTATVQYATGYSKAKNTWWPPDADLDTSIDSPYNTYLHAGLPPGPISNPGLSALEAALNPTPSKWLFFQVLTVKGHAHTYFCETYACFQSQGGVVLQ